MHRISVLVGSLRKDSINLRLAKALSKLLSDKMDFHFVELNDVPMYNEDLWENVPDSVMQLKKDVEFADAVLFVTPEYNRSFSPVIKNAIDWATRPYGQNSWKDKPAAIIGATLGAIGTAAAQAQLRAIIPVLGMPLMSQPEVHFHFKEEDFDSENNILNAKTKEFLQNFLSSFDEWIKRTAKS